MDFIFQQILFFFAIILILFIPGYFLLLAIFGKSKIFSDLEKFVVAFGLSIITVDFLMLIIGKAGILFTRLSIILGIFIFSAICYGIYFFKKRKLPDTSGVENNSFNFSKNQTLLIILILFLTVFIKTIYLTDTISPTATDLGHHMYWVEKIIKTGELPVYQKIDIVQDNGNYAISEPQRIDDFIIGEHLIFAAIKLISGQGVISAFPSLVLFLINIMGILAIFVLAKSFFKTFSFGKNSAIILLLLLGPIYALSAPQGNYVSGGVIGNLLGNLLIPLAFYFLFRGVAEKKSSFFTLGLFIIFGLIYTHHLSAFIFGIACIFALGFFTVLNIKRLRTEFKKIFSIFLSPSMLFFLAAAITFFFFVHTPSYIENSAVKTVIGKPSRITKAGLNLSQIELAVGEARAALGIVGVALILFLSKKIPYQGAIISGWLVSVFILSWKPTLLSIDIPSIRIANYLIFPIALSAAFLIGWFFFQYLANEKRQRLFINQKIFQAAFLLMFIFIISLGLLDNSNTLKINGLSDGKLLETFAVSRYLADRISGSDIIIKDHNYVPSDSWMKLFFMRDYNFPLTRGYLFRYDSPKKEKCTLWTIASPNSPEAEKCFKETGINFAVVNPKYSSAQFENMEQFWKVFASNSVAAYYKSN